MLNKRFEKASSRLLALYLSEKSHQTPYIHIDKSPTK
jgi:hypothetical protein